MRGAIFNLFAVAVLAGFVLFVAIPVVNAVAPVAKCQKVAR